MDVIKWKNDTTLALYRDWETGCINGDCENGEGVYIWSDGEIYNGSWINRKRNGFGTRL